MNAKPKRHWYQFSLKTLLVALTLLASVPVEPLLDVSPTALPLMKSWPITRILRPIILRPRFGIEILRDVN